jgi:hypothetical protein
LTSQETAKASLIQSKNGNISMTTEDDILISGSDIVADNGDIVIDADDVTIEAARQEGSTKMDAKHESLTTTILTTAGFAMPTYSNGDAHDTGKRVTHRNSTLSAKNGTVHFKKADEVLLEGANISGKIVDMTGVEGDITARSVQDVSTREQNSQSISVGQQMGYSTSHDNSDKKWTNNQTSIVATEKVDIKADTFRNEGALIANITEDGTDGGNLNIEANKVIATDLNDNDERDAEYAREHWWQLFHGRRPKRPRPQQRQHQPKLFQWWSYQRTSY